MKTKLLVVNRRSSYDYNIEKDFEAGIILKGDEVKSFRNGNVAISESFCVFKNNELFLKNLNVRGRVSRDIKLLLNKSELTKLKKNVEVSGYTIIPISAYSNETGLIKIKIAVAKGKKNYDKRNSLKSKELKRDIDRNLKN